MINWTLFQPRNLAVLSVFIVISYMIYKHFSAKLGVS